MDDGRLHWLITLGLAAAGLLKDKRATTHWLSIQKLRELGVDAVDERVVIDGKTITSAGVSAGIDMAIMLVALTHDANIAQAIQLAIEYDPEPPYDSGSPGKAPAALVELVRAVAAAREPAPD